jgi:hypothetical protein
VASDSDYNKFCDLGGELDSVDTPLEIALLSTCAGVVDIRPVEAVNMLPADDPKLVDKKLGAAAYMDMQMARFLGSDPAPHAAALKFITDRGRVTEAEIKTFMTQGIAQAVDAEFNKVSFLLENSRTYSSARSHSAVLTRNPQNGEYILSYEGTYTKGETRTIKANSLTALLSEMRDGRYKADFDQTGRDQVQSQAAMIPAVLFDKWRSSTPSMVNPYELLTKALTDFYITPNKANYEVVRGILAREKLAMFVETNINKNEDAFIENSVTAISSVLEAMSPELQARISRELRDYKVLVAAAEIPDDDPRYGIFMLNIASGDEIFISKKRSATGLMEVSLRR